MRAATAATPVRLGAVGRFLVPMHGPSAIAYFVERLFVAHGLGQRLLWNLLRAAGPRVAPHLLFEGAWVLQQGRLVPATDPTGPPSPADRAPWRGAMALLEGLPHSGGDADSLARPSTWDHPILLRDYGTGERSRLVVFPFHGDVAQPRAVLKIRDREDGGRPLCAEWEALLYLAERLPPALAARVPAPLGYSADARTEILLMSHLPGTSAYAHLQNDLRPGRRVARHLAAAATWLADFQLATQVPGRGYTPGDRERELAALAAGAEGRAPVAAPCWLEDLGRLCAAHAPAMVAAHGDFWSRNLLLDTPGLGTGTEAGSGAAVVDWEHFEPEAPPWLDLFSWPVTYGLDYPWRRFRRLPIPEAFRRTFLEDNPVSRRVGGYLRHCTTRTGLHPALLAPFLRLHLLHRALGATGAQHRQWIECAGCADAAMASVLRG